MKTLIFNRLGLRFFAIAMVTAALFLTSSTAVTGVSNSCANQQSACVSACSQLPVYDLGSCFNHALCVRSCDMNYCNCTGQGQACRNDARNNYNDARKSCIYFWSIF